MDSSTTGWLIIAAYIAFFILVLVLGFRHARPPKLRTPQDRIRWLQSQFLQGYSGQGNLSQRRYIARLERELDDEQERLQLDADENLY